MAPLRTALGVVAAFCLGVASCGPTEDTPDAGACEDQVELCNFLDDDCDGLTDEDFAGQYGTPCDGPDSDLCKEGLFTCTAAGQLGCSDTTGDNVERCNGLDDDCDGQTDEGFALGIACDSEEDADLCNDDITVCNSTGDRIICANVTPDAVELCNGIDDDCDGLTDEGFNVGGPCDSDADTDLCAEGILVCNAAGTGTLCVEEPGDNVELCNGVDDDCDGQTDEGFPNLGMPCDGADIDSCPEGIFVCNAAGTGTVCNDTNDLAIEKCNGLDDDCDGLTDEGFNVGAPCDGPDADLCKEGTVQCISDTETACTDTSGDNEEICDGLDNDCDGETDEGMVCCRELHPQGNPFCQPEMGETCLNCGDCRECGDGHCGCGETAANCPADC